MNQHKIRNVHRSYFGYTFVYLNVKLFDFADMCSAIDTDISKDNLNIEMEQKYQRVPR